MDRRTQENTITKVVGLTPVILLPNSPRRKAFITGPLAGGPGSAIPVLAAVFGAGANQFWTVPPGVTQVYDIYTWGPGGNSGASGGVLGGGGGGGGGFADSGPLTVVPGNIFPITVGAGGSATASAVKTPANVSLTSASAGATAVNDAAGAGGNGTKGAFTEAGGSGAAATGLVGVGAGGGGAGGAFAAGVTPVGQAGGAGGGAVQYLAYGVGGAGGNGGSLTFGGNPGNSPGAGGGGAATGVAGVGAGSDGLVVVLYAPPLSAQALSISHRQDVQAGLGIINFLPGLTYPVTIDIDEIGSIIKEEWWAVSGVAGVTVQITEYLYESEEDCW
jgi:hypothetical protein